MRATEIIRNILDIIDDIENSESSGIDAEVTVTAQGDDIRRFKQIAGLQDEAPTAYSNTPDERVSSVAAVTTDAGGGWQAPKHPADIRGEHPSLYPGKVYGAK